MALPVNAADEWKHPREKLPIATDPTVLASGMHMIARWKIVEHLDIRCQPAARKVALEEIVAKQRILWDPAF